MLKSLNAVSKLKLFFVVLLFVGCKPENNNSDSNNGGGYNGGNTNYEVRVTTNTPYDITQTTAVCGGSVSVSGGVGLNSIGVCWSRESNPTIEDTNQNSSSWESPFVCTVTGLLPNTQYHVRAYVSNGSDVFYGDDKSFVTKKSGSGVINGHEYVNLGLPSGTLWATCNIGANTPEEFGNYYAWAEVETSSSYDWSNYTYCRKGSENNLTKYCNDSHYGYYGFTDDLTVLELSDDAASVNWGGGWCTPSNIQWEELFENTTNSVTEQQGVFGWQFTSSNGNSLFLPAAGLLGNNGIQLFQNQSGYYWSNMLFTSEPSAGCNLIFGIGGGYGLSGLPRCYGGSVRPVCSAAKACNK